MDNPPGWTLREGDRFLLPLDPAWLPLDAVPLEGPWETLWRARGEATGMALALGDRRLPFHLTDDGLFVADGLSRGLGTDARRLMVEAVSVAPEVVLRLLAADEPCAVAGLGTITPGRLAPFDACSDRLHRLALELGRCPALSHLVSEGLVTGFSPFDYQKRVARRVIGSMRGQAILADEVGLGKTIEAGLVLLEYQARGLVRRALVLCPPSLVSQWVDELRTRFNVAAIAHDDPAFRSAGDARFGRWPAVVASLHTAKRPPHKDEIVSRPWDMVIVDEAHHVAGGATASHRLVASIEKKFILLLTATPIQNDLRELYNLVTLLRPGEMGTWGQFRTRFVGAGGVKDVGGLRALLKGVMVRNRRADCGIVLPPRYARTHVVTPTAGERAIYDDATSWVRDRAGSAGPGRMLALKTVQRTAGSSPWALASTLDGHADGPARAIAVRASSVEEFSKARALVDILKGIDSPAVVFTQYRATQEGLARRLERAGLAVHLFSGASTRRQRDQAIDTFRDRGGVLLATEAGAEGRNLQFAHHLVNFDVPWNPMRIEQRLGRVHRIGQEHPVHVHTLVSAGTVEADLIRVLEEKVALFELVLGELDVILGKVEEDEPFEEEVFRVCVRSGGEDARRLGLEAIGELLRLAKEDYLATRERTDAITGGALAADA